MNQYQWTFLDNAARRHTLGIAHSARSGHLVVHCNSQIVKIDFSVLEPKTFSFFVEEELCHLAIEGTKQSGFTYNFNIDTEVDTPVNRARKIQRITSARRSALSLSAALLLTFGLLGSVAWWGFSTTQTKLQHELILTGVPADARLVRGATVEFVTPGGVVTTEPLDLDARRVVALAAQRTVAIPIRYAVEKPARFVVDWRRVFANVESDTAPTSPAAGLLVEALGTKLPAAAGSPICALRAAGRLGGFRDQIALIDAYLLKAPVARQRWDQTIPRAHYRAQLRAACPPPPTD